jgi:hypothetical protein
VARQKAEVARKHEMRLLERNELRTGIRRNPNIPPKKVNTDRAKLNMQKKTDEKMISESDKYNKLYREIKSWNDGDFRHGRGFHQEKAIHFTVSNEEIGVKRDAFILKRKKKDWKPVDFFLNMFGRPNQSKSNSETLDRLLESTNEYILENLDAEKGRPPARKVGGRPEGARAGPTADRDDGYVTQAGLLTFLGLNMLMGYHYLAELSLYWAQDPDLGLGIVQQSMTRDRFKFISKHVAITSPEDLSISNEERGKPDPLGRVRWLINHLNLRFKDCRQAPRVQSIDEGMVKFKGRSSIRQSVANKPIRKVFKVYKRCDSKGYTYRFEVYQGMRASENHEAQATPSTENMVLYLCRSLRKKGHIVAFDRFFSTVPLIDRLHEAGINAVGTIDLEKPFSRFSLKKI